MDNNTVTCAMCKKHIVYDIQRTTRRFQTVDPNSIVELHMIDLPNSQHWHWHFAVDGWHHEVEDDIMEVALCVDRFTDATNAFNLVNNYNKSRH